MYYLKIFVKSFFKFLFFAANFALLAGPKGGRQNALSRLFSGLLGYFMIFQYAFGITLYI